MYGAWSQLIRSGSSENGQSYLYLLACLFKDIPIYIKAVFFRQYRVFLNKSPSKEGKCACKTEILYVSKNMYST